MSVQIIVDYYPNGFSLRGNHGKETKEFDSETSAVNWCIKNSNYIFSVNNFRTRGKAISNTDALNAIHGYFN